MAAAARRRSPPQPPRPRRARTGTQARPALSGWLGAGTRPLRVGVYRRRAPAGPYSCWDGHAWFGDAPSAARAASSRTPSAIAADWRGLARPAAVPCRTCRGHGVIDHGIDAETGLDRIVECPACAEDGFD